jgi:iron complex transport system permease protein
MLATMVVLLCVAVVFRLLVGDRGGGFHWPESGDLWRIRSDRVVAGLVVGISLAVGGVMLQSLLRNPLASPDLIGPGAGAGLGVMVAIYLTTTESGPVISTAALAVPALIGALIALGLVYILSQRRGFVEPVSLVLVGVMVSIICGALTMLVSRLLPPDAKWVGAAWMYGSIGDDIRPSTLWMTGAVAVAATAFGAWAGPAMDAAAMSEDEARSVGVAVGPLRLALFGCSGALAAGAVVLAGPIGFVGLVCPHLFRLLAGPGHRALILGSAATGAALVVAADGAVKVISVETGRLPIGILTTLIGGPVFLMLLRKSATASD